MRQIPECEAAEEQDIVDRLNENGTMEEEMDDDEIIAAVTNNTEDNTCENKSDGDQEI